MAGSAIVGTLRAILTLDTAEFESNSARVSNAAKGWTKDLKSMGSQATAIGGALTKTLTLPIVGLGYAAVEAGAGFEQTMNQVAAVTDASAEDMKRLSDAALEWGQKTKFSNKEAADAMLELGKAGFDANQTIAALPSTLQLATAANMGLGEAAQLTANVMNTFGLQATDLAHANDVLTAAANKSTIDVADLRESLKFVGPVAHIAGVSLADVAAAAALLGQNGIKADMAGTGMRGMFASLLAPAKPLIGMLDNLGFQTELAAHKTVDWAVMLDRLHEKFGEGKDKADSYAGQIMLAFGKRAGPAVIAMAQQGGEAIKQLSVELDNSAGVAAKMTDAYMKGTAGAIENLKGSLETAASTLLTAIEPVLIPILDGLRHFADFLSGTLIPAFTALPQPIQTVAVVLTGLLAAAGPVLVVLGTLLSAASSIAAAFTTTGIATVALSSALPVLEAAFALLTGPIGLIVGAVVGLGLAWHTWGDDVKRIVGEAYAAVKDYLWDKLEPVLTPIIGLLDSVGKMFEAFGALVGAVVEKVYAVSQSWLGEKLGAAFDTLKSVVQTVVEFISKWVGKIPDSFLPLMGPIGLVVLAFRHWDEIATIAQSVYTGVKTWLLDKFTGIVDGIKAKIDAVTGFFKEMADKIVMHSYVPDMIDGIGQHFGRLDSVMVRPARIATEAVTLAFKDMPPAIAGAIGDFVGAASRGLDGLKEYAWNFARDFTAGFLDVLVPGLGQIVTLAWPLIKEGLEKLSGLIAGFFRSIWDGIKGIWDGIKGLFGFGGGGHGTGTIPTPPGDLPPDSGGYTPGGSGYDENGGIDPNGPYGSQLPGFKTGTGGRFVDFGAGTLAMLHGPEMIVPKGEGMDVSKAFSGGGGGSAQLSIDGRQIARAIWPYLVGEVQRLQLTR